MGEATYGWLHNTPSQNIHIHPKCLQFHPFGMIFTNKYSYFIPKIIEWSYTSIGSPFRIKNHPCIAGLIKSPNQHSFISKFEPWCLSSIRWALGSSSIYLATWTKFTRESSARTSPSPTTLAWRHEVVVRKDYKNAPPQQSHDGWRWITTSIMAHFGHSAAHDLQEVNW